MEVALEVVVRGDDESAAGGSMSFLVEGDLE